MANVHYEPQSLGLTLVGELDEADLSYEYNTLDVWQHEASGRVFYAQDSGCSCPTPFEDYFFRGPDENNLTEVTKGDAFESFVREVESWAQGYSSRRAPLDEQEALISKVKKLVNT